jgi:hypothetical protein
MEPSDYYDTHINKVLHFIRNAQLIWVNKKREAQEITEGRNARAGSALPSFLPSFIHSSIQYDRIFITVAVIYPTFALTWNTFWPISVDLDSSYLGYHLD